MAINSKVKYYKNISQGPVRVVEHSIPAKGAIQVPTEETSVPKFANAVDVLIVEITKTEYDEIVQKDKQLSNIRQRRDLPKVITVVEDRTSSKGWKEVEQSVETDLHPKEIEAFRNQQTVTEGVRPEIPVDQFAGADFATGSRPDDGDR
jgi:hypothetical protein